MNRKRMEGEYARASEYEMVIGGAEKHVCISLRFLGYTRC